MAHSKFQRSFRLSQAADDALNAAQEATGWPLTEIVEAAIMAFAKQYPRPADAKSTGCRRIIQGKLYNTATATLLATGEWAAADSLGWICEDLYIGNSGAYFLHGRGGPATCYAESADDNSAVSGETIIPMTVTDAKQWVERYLGADDYIRIFGRPGVEA